MTPREKIELMLSVYREKYEKAGMPPADHPKCVELQAQIGILETLYYYFLQEEGKQ